MIVSCQKETCFFPSLVQPNLEQDDGSIPYYSFWVLPFNIISSSSCPKDF